MNTELNHNNGSTEFLNFSDALNHLRWGDKIARRSWNGSYVKADYGHKMGFIKYDRFDVAIRTTLSGIDIMAEDWFVL